MALAQSMAQARDTPLNREGLCILSLDGGGVRGLSSLLIIKALMAKVNEERKKEGRSRVKPCQLFDLIGGTSTGGIIAIMLGRLEMDIDECIDAYTSMFQRIFATKGLPIGIFGKFGKIKGRFDSAILENCIREILQSRKLSDAELFNDGKERCKVAVCAKDVAVTSTILIRSYHCSDELNNIPATICHAVRATSAASSFFDPVTIQPYGRRFVDGGLGANNPVEQLWNEAQRIWCKDERIELSDILKCFVSIGTGHPGTKALNEGAWKFFRETLLSITTETEHTAKIFLERHLRLYESKRYFRFNVQQGLQGVELQEYQAVDRIASATVDYMDAQETRSAAQECAMNLKRKQFHLDILSNIKSIIKWSSQNRLTGQTPITFIPYNRNDNFVNRNDAVKDLNRLLALPSCNLSISIWGLGGCGKTQIAIEYAYRLQEEISCSIFWVHADSEARFTKDYSDLARLAGLSPDLKGEDLLSAVQQWMEQQQNWLLVLDNADDLKIFRGTDSGHNDRQIRGPELIRFVPKSQRGTVLWVSRDGGIVGSITDVGRDIKLGAMSDEESCELFQRLSNQNEAELSLDEDKLLELLDLIERLPLAIVQAASYIRRTKVSIKQYLEFYKESESRQSELLHQGYQDAYRSEVPKSVMHTWLISMRQIAEESPCSENILRTLAFFDNSGIPFDLIKMAAGPDFDNNEILLSAGRLMEYSFLQGHKELQKDFPVYEQHCLVQLATRQSLSAVDTRWFSGEALSIIRFKFPNGMYETWDTCRLYLPHALKVVELEEAEDYAYHAPKILEGIGIYYSNQGRSNEAEKAHAKLLKLREETLGNESPGTIGAMQYLAMTWADQGRFIEAEGLQAKVLQLRRALSGDTDDITIIAKSNLATIWNQQGRLGEAEKLRSEVVEQQKKVHIGKMPDTLTIAAMGNLALSWLEQGKLLAAEDLGRQVLELSEEALGHRHPGTTVDMANLATIWCELGRFGDAARLQGAVLRLQTEILGEEHPYTIVAMNNLARTRSKQGRFDEAEAMNTKVLQLREELLGMSHPSTLIAMANLAASWTEQGRLSEAAEQLDAVLKVQTEILGRKHPNTIATMSNLALTWSEQGRLDEAEGLRIEVLDLWKEVLGMKHLNTLSAIAHLAITKHQQGKLDEAERQQLEVLNLLKEGFGEKHPNTITAMANLAVTIGLQGGRYAEVQDLEIEVLKLQQEVLGSKHPLTITATANLGVTYLHRGMPRKAQELLAEAFELRKEVLGISHPQTVKAEEDLEQLTGAIDRYNLRFAQQRKSLHKFRSRRKNWGRKFTKWRKLKDGRFSAGFAHSSACFSDHSIFSFIP